MYFLVPSSDSYDYDKRDDPATANPDNDNRKDKGRCFNTLHECIDAYLEREKDKYESAQERWKEANGWVQKALKIHHEKGK